MAPKPLKPYLAFSIVLHALLAVAITVGILLADRQVQRQEALFIADVQQEEQRLEQRARQARAEALREMLAEQARAEMQQLVAEQLAPEHEQQLVEQTRQDVAEQLAQWDQQTDLDALINDEFHQLSDQLREQWFEDLRLNLEQMKQDLLISEVRRYIRRDLAPALKRDIDRRMKQVLGERVRAATAKQLEASRKPDEAEKPRQEAADRQVVADAMAEVDQAMRQRVRQEVTDTAVPVAAERLTRALDTELRKRDLADEKFRQFVEKDIRQALAEEMERRPPDAELLTAKTRRAFAVDDASDLTEAQQELSEIREALEALAEEQDARREAVPEDTPSQDAMRQHELADRVRKTREGAAAVLERARRATLTQDARIDEAAEQVTDPAPDRTAVEAARALQRNVVEDAKEMMTDVADQLRQSATSLAEVERGLAEEAEALEAPPVLEGQRAEAPEPVPQEAVAELAERAKEAAEAQLEPEVTRAARRVDVDKPLESGDSLDDLARMAELEERLDRIAANRADGRELADAVGLGIPGPGQGLGPGGLPSLEQLEWTVPHHQAMTRINLRAYREFVRHMQDRLNPDNYYTPEPGAAEDATVARLPETGPAAVVFVDRDTPAGPADAPDADADAEPAERRVPEPAFATLAFGAAAMMERPVTIDGDLSDWGELRHGLELRYIGRQLEKVEDGPTVFVRWSPDGLYFGYTVDDPNGIQPCPEFSWKGDCLEVMVDMANSRRERAYQNVDAQKFQLTPFGAKGRDELRIWEMGRGLRGLVMARGYPDVEGVKGDAAARRHDGGYTVEGFISRRALSRPHLVPGRYIALNFSLNRGGDADTYQWSASQQLQTWRRPDTWGDLLLLGSDAKLSFVRSLEDDTPLDAIAPQGVLAVQIRDADMNLNTRKIDRIPAQLQLKEAASSLFVVLAETGPNTGLFRASVNTQPHFMEPAEHTLNVRSGDTVQLIYTDARTEYGERNRRLTAELPVGWPVMQFGGR